MARFRYRMQNILDVKEKLETQAKNEFAIANNKLREEENKLDALYKRKEDYEERLRELYNEALEIFEIKETQDAVENMKLQIENQILNVKYAQKVVDQARDKLTEAMLERKTHEKLKEKQFDQFLLEEAAKESKEIDEVVSFRHGQSDE